MSSVFNEFSVVRTAVAIAAGVSIASSASADIDPLSGIDFVRVGAVGNQAWQGNSNPGDRAVGRGQVNYEYRIGRYEVTTAQWVEFFNAAFDRPAGDALPHLIPPDFWGAAPTTPNTPGGLRWTVPAGNEMRAVGNISWRMAAMYCNWLHNDKATNREAFLNGAYDVSTFGYTQAGRFTDQLTHNTGARYWIPTWDEWLKAAHYDPNKHGPDQGGWWTWNNSSDVSPIQGPPGIGTANFGWDSLEFPGHNPFAVLLGAYANVTSPWGLFDAAGATSEWTEEAFFPTPSGGPSDRRYDGSSWIDGSNEDLIAGGGSEFPSYSGFGVGLRVVAAIPSPATSALLVIATLTCGGGRRRRLTNSDADLALALTANSPNSYPASADKLHA